VSKIEINLPSKKLIEDKIKENNDVFLTHREFERLIKNIVSHPQSILLNLRYTIKCIRKSSPFHTYQFGSEGNGKTDHEKNVRLNDNRDSLCIIRYRYRYGNHTAINDLDDTLQELFESFWKSPLRTPSAGMLDLKRDKRVSIIANNTLKLYTEKKIRCSLLFCDIDNFKKINHTFGHDYGDRAILKIASIIEFTTRNLAVPLHRGGDEFLLLLPNGGMKKSKVMANKINNEIEQYEFGKAENKFKFSTSVGMATTELGDDISFSRLLEKADKDLRDKKERVKNV
jgi:diguanylate cyclase (GGDEF)-like protein